MSAARFMAAKALPDGLRAIAVAVAKRAAAAAAALACLVSYFMRSAWTAKSASTGVSYAPSFRGR